MIPFVIVLRQIDSHIASTYAKIVPLVGYGTYLLQYVCTTSTCVHSCMMCGCMHDSVCNCSEADRLSHCINCVCVYFQVD